MYVLFAISKLNVLPQIGVTRLKMSHFLRRTFKSKIRMRNLQGGCKISFVFSGFRISVTSIVFEGLKKLSTDLKCHLIKYSTLNPSSFPIPQGQARGILLVCHWIPVPHWQFLKNVCSSVMVLLGQMSMFSSLKMCFLFRPSTTRRCKRCPC